MVGHVLVAACFVAFLALGWWQWERAHAADGGGQNLGYALQWPLFAAFIVYGWWRAIRIELHKSEPPEPPSPRPVQPPRTGPAVPRYVAPPIQDDGDEELAAYNRHLASLHEQDQQK
jgi:DNA-binding transcriptional regulator of glucitol operon